MNIYLACRYSRREEMLRYADELTARGHRITSRWIFGEHELIEGLSSEAVFDERRRFAAEDLRDLCDADCIVNFTEPPRGDGKSAGRGGRHVEFGYALALSAMRRIVVGYLENVFHCLAGVEFCETWAEAAAIIGDAPKLQVACGRCDGCGRIANDDDGTPWSVWENIPLKSSAAVLGGIIKPLTCPECGGTGKAVLA